MIEHDNVYDALTVDNGNTQWAFGTDFDDPLAGVDTSVPDDIDAGLLAQYCIMLGDDALISAQRLIEWITRAPELEQELGMANMALDLLGQARLLFTRASAADPTVVPYISPTSPAPPDDRLAFFRSQEEFRCVRICELDNGDFAHTIVRMLIFSTWRLGLFERLTESRDPFLAAVSHKWCQELAYHRDYAARWTVILAGGPRVTPSHNGRAELPVALHRGAVGHHRRGTHPRRQRGCRRRAHNSLRLPRNDHTRDARS